MFGHEFFFGKNKALGSRKKIYFFMFSNLQLSNLTHTHTHLQLFFNLEMEAKQLYLSLSLSLSLYFPDLFSQKK
jgi:hypothetical protein